MKRPNPKLGCSATGGEEEEKDDDDDDDDEGVKMR